MTGMEGQTSEQRIAALEQDLADLRRLIGEYLQDPCRLDWDLSCQEHPKGDGDCLVQWAKSEID